MRVGRGKGRSGASAAEVYSLITEARRLVALAPAEISAHAVAARGGDAILLRAEREKNALTEGGPQSATAASLDAIANADKRVGPPSQRPNASARNPSGRRVPAVSDPARREYRNWAGRARGER